MTAEPCVHRWRIATPVAGQPTVLGSCRLCGARREFAAWPDFGWTDSGIAMNAEAWSISAINGRHAAMRARKEAQG